MRVVLLTHDPTLADEVTRLAAAAGVRPDVVGADECLAVWPGASVLLVGADVADAVVAHGPPRREDTHVVSGGHHGDAVYRAAVALGATTVAELPAAQEWLVELLTDVGERPARGRTVGVLGGAGGAGASTLACALAQVGAADGSALLLDLDPVGAGLDRMLGLELVDGVRWPELARMPGRLSARALRESVPRHGGLGVLGWGAQVSDAVDPATARAALEAARRGNDLVVLDLPRSGGRLAHELAARCDELLVVVPASVLGVASTCRLLAALGPIAARTGLVLRHGPVLAQEVEATTGRPVVALVREQRGLAEALDLGVGPARSPRSPSARAARTLLGRVA